MEYTLEKLLSGKANMIIHTAVGNQTQLHSHEFIELAYVTKGAAVHHIDGKEIFIKKGDYFIIDFNATHGYSPYENQPLELVHCLFLPKVLDESLSLCRSFHELSRNYLIRFNRYQLREIPTEYVFHDDNGSILSLIYLIDQEATNKQAGHLELQRCFLIEILVLSMRKIYTAEKETKNELIGKIITYIDQNLAKDLSLKQICAEVNYSFSYISRKFKEEMGVNFNKYVQQKRIERACHLLATTNKSVTEIAQESGYSDYPFFLKIFKSHLQISPSGFRKLHK